ncbi:MAG TPA: PQQ-binding-like beta-propeller repeat protein, partial [Solirubrobacteraceae bacterium]|nr:PQQ-binding-like beta-propeller repeat protein [Solirubrobacteraceae bacterium]
HHDPERSGADPETAPAEPPSLAWQSADLGAPIWSQPLVLGQRVYVATVGDELYALNAATGAVEWAQSAGTPVPAGELECGDIQPTVGIVGTPVIDLSTHAIYAVADTWNGGEAEHLLEGFDLQTGARVLSTPVDPPEARPRDLLERTGLNLDGGRIVFGMGGNDGDCGEYRGTVVAAPEDGGAPRFWQVPIKAPALWGGAVWAPSGPAVDEEGQVYATSGNPDPPEGEEVSEYDYSDSVIELDLADFTANPLSEQGAPLGWFEPPTWRQEGNNDLDLSSAGPELLPGGLLFQAGKDGVGYLIDEAAMEGGAPAVYSHEVCGGHGSFGGDAYASGVIYIPCTNGVQALAYNESARTFTPLWQGPADALGPPILSGGLVWSIATGGFKGGGQTLYGLNPETGAASYVEHLPSPVIDHFASPSAAGGRLFVSTGESVTAYRIAASAGGEPAPTQQGAAGEGATATTSTSPRMAPLGPVSTVARASHTPELLRRRLRADRGGRVAVALRCPAARGGCHGTLTLVAEIAVGARGGRGARHPAAIALSRAHFRARARGDFTLTLRLSHSAEAHLRRHHGRLAVRVVLATPDAPTSRYPGLLTG